MVEAQYNNPFVGVNPPSQYHPISFDFRNQTEALYWKEIQRPGMTHAREIVGMDPFLYHVNYLPPIAYSKSRSLFDIVDIHEERLNPKSLEWVSNTIHMRARLMVDEHVSRLTKPRDLLITLAQLLKQTDLSITADGIFFSDPDKQKELWSFTRNGSEMVSSIPVVNGDPFLMVPLGEIAHIEECADGRKFIAAPLYDSKIDVSGKFKPYHVTATYMISYSPSLLSAENYDALIGSQLSRSAYDGKDLHSKIDPFIEISFGE